MIQVIFTRKDGTKFRHDFDFDAIYKAVSFATKEIKNDDSLESFTLVEIEA